MAWTKEDRSFKILIGKKVTSKDKAYYEEYGAPTLDLQFAFIKTDKIPDNDPAAAVTAGVAQQYSHLVLRADSSVRANQAYYAYDSVNNQTLGDWIGGQNGPNYEVTLYDANGTQITLTDDCQWFFDYPTGILTFNGSVDAKAKPFQISGYRYIGRKGGEVGGSGKIGQKPVHDTPFFPAGTSAEGRVPVYREATGSYELETLPSLEGGDIILIAKPFVGTGASVYTVDTHVEKVVSVTSNGVFLTEGRDYTRSGKTFTFTNPVASNTILTIVYFESLSAILAGSVEWVNLSGDPAANQSLTTYITSLAGNTKRVTREYDLTSSTQMDLTTTPKVNEVTLTSTNSAESLGIVVLPTEYQAVRLYPQEDLTLTLSTHLTDSNLRLEGNVDTVLVGSDGDWIELTRRGNTVFQTNIGTYGNGILPPAPGASRLGTGTFPFRLAEEGEGNDGGDTGGDSAPF